MIMSEVKSPKLFKLRWISPTNWGWHELDRKFFKKLAEAQKAGRKWAKEMKDEDHEEGTTVEIIDISTGERKDYWVVTDEGVEHHA